MKKKVLSALLISTMVSSILAGCGTPTTTNVVEENEIVIDKEAKEGVTLSMCFHNTEEFYESDIVTIVEEFKKLHPEVIDVEYTTLSGMSDEQQVTRLTGGQYEDIVLIPSILLASELNNYFTPLGDAKEFAQKYYYGDYMQYEGQSYGIPIGVVYEGLVYNKKVLKQYFNGNIPKTLTELKDDLVELKKNNITGIVGPNGSGKRYDRR